MEYPVWQLAATGGGFWIAVIATLHVFVAHFAVGGGLFLVLAEAKGHREQSPAIVAFAQAHAKFFLLLTMVFGGVSGVGIWFTISVLAPAATSTLIHHFVWGWATEWVFFVGEIVALIVYQHSFGRMNPRDHLKVGWLYFVFAWLSLLIINGIVGFMLTPGDWLATRDFWDGFLNPSFWPSLVFRTLLAFLLAGLFGFLTAIRIKEPAAREKMVRTCAAWAVASLPPLLLAGWWYLAGLPPATFAFITRGSTEIAPVYRAFPFLAAAVLAGAILMAVRLPLFPRAVVAALLLAGGFGVIGSFEYLREAARKPWLIPGHTWSTGIRPDQAGDPGQPFLPRAKWVRHREITPQNRLAAGSDLFAIQCLACHSVGGLFNDIKQPTAQLGLVGVEAFLTGQGRLFGHMPPFLGSPSERNALASHLVATLHGKSLAGPREVAVKPLPLAVPPFDAAKDEYVLLAWNTLGMKCVTDGDAWLSFLPPGNALGAILLKRGEAPEVVSEGVELSYQAPEGFQRPSAHVDFWKYAETLVGKRLKPDLSAAGKGMDGSLAYHDQAGLFEAAGIPLVPYGDDGSVNPYPLFTITARDQASGRVLAQTQAVLPVGTEMGCKSCHGGGWRKNDATGLSGETALGILAAHDKRSGTRLAAGAREGRPLLCQSCHPDPVLNAKGNPALLNLSAAMHGFHAHYLREGGGEVCAHCHPASPTGVTRCLRDNHAAKGLDCRSCHGHLEDHAISLLTHENEVHKKSAAWLLQGLKPRSVDDPAQIKPREPWLQEPDCLACHQGGQRPVAATASAFNAWSGGPAELYRNRKEETGKVPCIACHGASHATYPATNAYGGDRDNLQPLQYMGFAGPLGSRDRCDVCHGQKMEDEAHHAAGLVRRR